MTAVALWMVWPNQLDQAFPGHDLMHSGQEVPTAGLFAFVSVFGVNEGQPPPRDSFNYWQWGISSDLKVFFRVSLSGWSTGYDSPFAGMLALPLNSYGQAEICKWISR